MIKKKMFWSQGDELIWVILPIKSKIFGTTLNLNAISVNLQAHSAFNPQFCIISHIENSLMIMRITMNSPLQVKSTQLLISKTIELFLKNTLTWRRPERSSAFISMSAKETSVPIMSPSLIISLSRVTTSS